MELKEISESEFRKLYLPILFENKLIDKVFGVISNKKSKYKLGWQSIGIKPIITLINSSLCSVGIDLSFAIFNDDKILLKLTLDYFFYETTIYNEFLYVITELEIIKIQIDNIAIVEIYALPDYFENIEFKKGGIIVQCINGEIVVIG